VNPIVRGGPFWTPITPQTRSFFHAESQAGSLAEHAAQASKIISNPTFEIRIPAYNATPLASFRRPSSDLRCRGAEEGSPAFTLIR
jgi:hypothetical protein